MSSRFELDGYQSPEFVEYDRGQVTAARVLYDCRGSLPLYDKMISRLSKAKTARSVLRIIAQEKAKHFIDPGPQD